MRVVVIGGGEVGFAVARALAPRHDVVVVDHAPAVADRFEELDVQFLVGTGTSAEVQQQAGVGTADVLVACTGLDEVNIVACTLAKQAGHARTFCFVSREDFVGGAHEAAGLSALGIDQLVWPEAQLAASIARIVREPGALAAEEFAGGGVGLVEYRLEPESELPGRRIADLGLPAGALIVGVRRGETFFIPRGDSTLASDDRTVVMGTPEALLEVRRRFVPGANLRRTRVAIIGGGDVGFQLALQLETLPGLSITVIERSRSRGEAISTRLRNALVLHADGTDLALLESEDIGRSDVLVSVIDNDERNLLASLLARQLGVRRIITRVSRRANLRLFHRVGIDVAISARGAAVASVLDRIEGGASRLLAVIEQGAGRLLELTVPAGYGTRRLRALGAPQDSIVGAIVRDGKAMVPHGDSTIEPGDRLLVFATAQEALRVRALFTGVTP
jgi:trk system potassium uptake protein TrkA